jgi:hypothetical protein
MKRTRLATQPAPQVGASAGRHRPGRPAIARIASGSSAILARRGHRPGCRMIGRTAAGWVFATAVIAIGVSAAQATADPVEILRFPVASTTTSSAACGFAIVRTDTGELVVQVRDAPDGSQVVSIHSTHYEITLANEATGKSVTSTRAFLERDTVYPDGTDIHFEAGLVAHLVLPGQGEVATNAGYIVAVFDPTGNVLSVRTTGPDDGPIAPYACEYLASP